MEIADRLIDAITDRFFLLGNHPYVGRLRDNLRPGLRSFPVGQYVIIYRIKWYRRADSPRGGKLLLSRGRSMALPCRCLERDY
jgi:plasmid stabilization system protein ParE